MEVSEMEHKNQPLEAEKHEITTIDETERTRDRQCFVPRADIYETDDYIIVVADIPGADENSTDITIEKNILTINANVDWSMSEDYGLNYGEYGIGDYQRSFTSRMRSTARISKPPFPTASCACNCPKPAQPRPRRSA
jgi:HSP20 family molecular chaperone IbpA